MKKFSIKKLIIVSMLIIYNFSNLLQSLNFVDFNKVYAESSLNETKLVAVFVENNIYENIKDDLERYATEYIQQSLQDSKAIVMPINTDEITAKEITKILENLYFDGISGEPSKLNGVVLIGNVPMPVVNQDGFIYPTIYPYVDFEEQKFVWDNNIKYFVYNNNPKGQAEIWHGIINFEEQSEYASYFEKLEAYKSNTSEFIGKKIWYDDLITNKRLFYGDGAGKYANNFIFAEDVGYQRFDDLMFNIMSEEDDELVEEVSKNYDVDISVLTQNKGSDKPTKTAERAIKRLLKSYTNLIGGTQLDTIKKNVETANRWIESYTGSDGELKYRTALDTHYLKVEQKDETLLRTEGGLEPMMIIFNNILEDAVDKKVDEEKYWMNEVLPLEYLEYDGEGKKRDKYDGYTNYLFGQRAITIKNTQQASAYRGTFRNFVNISGLTIQDIQEGVIPSLDIEDVDLNKKSVGGSYDIFAKQVEANRGYNIDNSQIEFELYQKKKIPKLDYWNTECDKKFLGICWVKRRRQSDKKPESHLCNVNNKEEQGGCESMESFSQRIWGGASPLNLSGDMKTWKQGYEFEDAVSPIFDIAGSTATTEAEPEANSFEGIQKYTRMIQKTFVPEKDKFQTKTNKEEPDPKGQAYDGGKGNEMKFTNWLPVGDLDSPTWKKINPLRIDSVDFFENMKDSSTTNIRNVEKNSKEGINIIKLGVGNKTQNKWDDGYGKIFTYKTIDTRQKNVSTSYENINSSTIKIFQDPSSEESIFYSNIYGEIKDKVKELDEKLDEGVKQNLKNIYDEYKSIENGLLHIDNYKKNDGNITNTANYRKNIINYDSYNIISGNVNEAKENIILLYEFLIGYGMSDIQNKISIEENSYISKKSKDPIILENWRDNLIKGLTEIKDKYSIDFKKLISDSESTFNNTYNINKASFKSKLINKKEEINKRKKDENEPIGCKKKYKELCSAIDKLFSDDIILNNMNNKKSEITNIKTTYMDEDGNEQTQTIAIGDLLKIMPDISAEYTQTKNTINKIDTTQDENMKTQTQVMTYSTQDRPIDSPRYLTFKGLGGDRVTFIYPNLYKAEIFSGEGNTLELKSPKEIANAIRDYLEKTVEKYNQYLENQRTNKSTFYKNNKYAFDWLSGNYDNMASPNREKKYNLIDEKYLIEELTNKLNNNLFFTGNMGLKEGEDPIDFIARMMYYQNITRQEKQVGETIEEDFKLLRGGFDINNKIEHIMTTYLKKDNNQGSFITPGYRDEGYEVAFINSDGNDYVSYQTESTFVHNLKKAVEDAENNKQELPTIQQTQMEEELNNECNISEAENTMLFDLTDFSSPWLNALMCRLDITKKKPVEFSFDRSSSMGPIFSPQNIEKSDNLPEAVNETLNDPYGEVVEQYKNQLGRLDNDDDNEGVLNNSSPGDYQKLEKILSYTKIKLIKKNIRADDPNGTISISSSIELGDVDFYVKNNGSNKIYLDGDTKTQITEGKSGYEMGEYTFEPFNKKEIGFEVENPEEGIEIITFYMCLPGTENIEENCVKHGLDVNIIPGEINTISIEKPSGQILKGAKMPIIVKGLDKLGNNVGQLFDKKFEIISTGGTLSYRAATSNSITFDDFDDSEFVLNADENLVDGDKITINVNGNINNVDGNQANTEIIAREGTLKAYQNESEINKIEMTLPDKNEYSYVDSWDITQVNLNTVPKIKLKLLSNDGNVLNMRNLVKITTRNGLLSPGQIDEREVTKTQDTYTFDVTQKRFSQTNNTYIEDGELSLLLMPTFKAGDDILYISMPGVETLEIPIKINPGYASAIDLAGKKDSLSTNSNTEISLKISDNRGNIITQDTNIKLGAIGPLNISGFDKSSNTITVKSGSHEFVVNSENKGGVGSIYATIVGKSLSEQKPGYKEIFVQQKMIPEENLNIMYLNLFGSDWGNQWGFMSDNNKYIQKLINGSEKLLAITTQLLKRENIKIFSTVISEFLEIQNFGGQEIKMSFDDKIKFDVEGIGEIYVKNLDDLEIQEINVSEENLESLIQDNLEKNKNLLIYIPEQTDSIIETNESNKDRIEINNENVLDISKFEQSTGFNITLSDETILGKQIWNVNFEGKNVGRIITSIKDKLSFEANSKNTEFDYNEVWTNGSTNKKGFGFYEIESQLSDKSFGYESIQDSDDQKLGIGFTADFKNITYFGGGKSVGEATIPFSSELLINIGDPLVKRIDVNETAKMLDTDLNKEVDSGFDKGLGEIIYSEPGKKIFKVINIDFNNDELEDIIVSFTDGSIKILKNYGGSNGFNQLGDLMTLADGIKDIVVGDVDGNDYEDIIIWNKSDTLRVYKNNDGIFEVDGFPICINTNVLEKEINGKPQDISGLSQIFFEDMDRDGRLDIITNDKMGYIKIFYGGESNEGENYVSKEKNTCDGQWYERQDEKIVHKLGIRINENLEILDQSLIRWKGINKNMTNNNIDVLDLGFGEGDEMTEEQIKNTLTSTMDFDMDTATQAYGEYKRYKKTDFFATPSYENEDVEENIEYTTIGCLTGDDPVNMYKEYEDLNGDVLRKGDKVQVTLTIEAKEDFVGTFIDEIRGPWLIPLTGENEMIENFWFKSGTVSEEQIKNKLDFYRDLSANARYMIDNIVMKQGEEIIFHYWMYYDGETELGKIELKDINGADYPKFGGEYGEILNEYKEDGLMDIKIKPPNGCNKSMFILFNKSLLKKSPPNREYNIEYVDLQKTILDLSNERQGNLNSSYMEMNNALIDGMSDGNMDFSSIPGLGAMTQNITFTDMLSEEFNWEDFVNNGLNLTNLVNIPSQLVDSLASDVMTKVDELAENMCAGFDLGAEGNCGLPVPFNQAFLGPGNYHLFGCWSATSNPPIPGFAVIDKTLGMGVPTLTIPGNRPSPAGYLPIPGIFGLPFKGPSDGFLGIKGGTRDSQFRLYIMPTLTAEIGVAMCFGPYAVGANIPDPLSSIGGNCVVAAFPLPCGGDDGNNNGPNRTNQIDETLLDLEKCSSSNVPCNIGEGQSSTPFERVGGSSESNNLVSMIPDGSYAGGFISLEQVPKTEFGYNKNAESEITIDGVKLFGGAEEQNKIQGAESQGLMEKIGKKRMDDNINYMMANISYFRVGITFPDFGKMFDGFDKLGKNWNDEKKKDCVEKNGSWNSSENECTISPEQKCKNKGMDRNKKTKTCMEKTNPDQNQDAYAKIDSWAENKLLERGQISDWSDSVFTNPFEKVEAMFQDVDLINLRTEDMTVKVPMISSEDISAYAYMVKGWIDRQEKILKQRLDFFKALIGWCGGDAENIKNTEDLKQATEDLKDKLKEEQEDMRKNEEIKGQKDELDKIDGKIKALEKLEDKFVLSGFGNYQIFEGCDESLEKEKYGEYYVIMVKEEDMDQFDRIIPQPIYIIYDPDNEGNELLSVTKGTTLISENGDDKNTVYLKGKPQTSPRPCFEKPIDNSTNACYELFLGGELDNLLNGFLQLHTNSTLLINTAKQNLETLELYKQFPMDLYEWMHVGDRYIAEISAIINNFLGTLSLRMKTNATRYSQYVDSLILIMTTIKTYQAIIDLSVNFSEKCSTCTNDNYDQFACKLGLLCPDGALPMLPMPPFKIPSIYVDLSDFTLGSDIKLPKFNFVPTTVPLPSLPNIPGPPNIDVSLDMEASLSLIMDFIKNLMAELGLDLNFDIPAMPLIPAPPTLPELPSFIPSVNLELPLLPPAPQIPKLPNELSAAIDIAETIGRILCIVKGNVGMVGESSLKAKVEQLTQRTYKVPYRDEIDQTVSQRKEKTKGVMPDLFGGLLGFLSADEFKEVELKGADILVESHVNLQFDFAGFYDLLQQTVNEINKYSSMPQDYAQEGVDALDELSREAEQRMSACVSNPISIDCLGEVNYKNLKEDIDKKDELRNQMKDKSTEIRETYPGIQEIIQEKNELEAKKQDIESKINVLSGELYAPITGLYAVLENLSGEIKEATGELKIKLQADYDSTENKINDKIEEIEDLKKDREIIVGKLGVIGNEYGDKIKNYEKKTKEYEELTNAYYEVTESLNSAVQSVKDGIQDAKDFSQGIEDGANDFINSDRANEWNQSIEKDLADMKENAEAKKAEREKNLKNLYKDTDRYGEGISYVDYSQKDYENSASVLKKTLTKMDSNAIDPKIKDEVEDYLDLINSDKKIVAKTENISKIGQEYEKIIASIKTENQNIKDIIQKDYDKFLLAVSDNTKTLVSDNEINLDLSSKLFEADQNTLDILKKQGSVGEAYIDYYSKNIDGYLNAMNNYSNEELNMDRTEYEVTKEYLQDLQDKTKLAYNTIENKKLIAANDANGSIDNEGGNNNYSVDLSSYINVIKTPEGSMNLANGDFVKKVQNKTLMVDLNDDGGNDLILRDDYNVYVKYRNQNNYYGEEVGENSEYYEYKINSIEQLENLENDGYVEIGGLKNKIKMYDENREIKGFKYAGGDFDSIKISWMNSKNLGDEPAGYLVKMIHRVDLFNDNIESELDEDILDKKYVLVTPKGATITGTKIQIEEGFYRTESLITGTIFDVLNYNENDDIINITIKDIPRNRQYTKVYTLYFDEDRLSYFINNPSSNQIVAGPQMVADTKGPKPTISIYRPKVESTENTGRVFDLYVSTNYILKSNWEDNISIDEVRITDEDGNIITEKKNIKSKTAQLDMTGLFFTGLDSKTYYFVGIDNDGNSTSTQVTLNINKPNIKITNIKRYGNSVEGMATPAQIIAEIDNDLDEGYVQFLRERNDMRQIITGTVNGVETNKYRVDPLQTIVTGGYYDLGNDIGLYLPNGELAVKINPNNGKIEILNGFEDEVDISLDYSMKIPNIRIFDNGGNQLFTIALNSKELIGIDTKLEVKNLQGDNFGVFDGGKAIVSEGENLAYIAPDGDMYVEAGLYGEYSFDDEKKTVNYSFKKSKNGEALGTIKVKVENLLGY